MAKGDQFLAAKIGPDGPILAADRFIRYRLNGLVKLKIQTTIKHDCSVRVFDHIIRKYQSSPMHLHHAEACRCITIYAMNQYELRRVYIVLLLTWPND